jgi:hypothetical protein
MDTAKMVKVEKKHRFNIYRENKITCFTAALKQPKERK